MLLLYGRLLDGVFVKRDIDKQYCDIYLSMLKRTFADVDLQLYYLHFLFNYISVYIVLIIINYK